MRRESWLHFLFFIVLILSVFNACAKKEPVSISINPQEDHAHTVVYSQEESTPTIIFPQSKFIYERLDNLFLEPKIGIPTLGAEHGPDKKELPGIIRTNSFGRSFALVVGINKYQSPSKWKNLHYALPDAESMVKYLNEQQGFQVFSLYNEKATRRGILKILGDEIPRNLVSGDRVIFFFSGHGATQKTGEYKSGYIVPYDGDEDFASWISVEDMQAMSQRMGVARHQLFLMDSCFGGFFTQGEKDNVNASISRFFLSKARQILTAGGEDEEVMDTPTRNSPAGLSPFTGYLLEALRDERADSNHDDVITFSELAAYMERYASNQYHKPRAATLPGHTDGSFLFYSTRFFKKRLSP